MAGRWVGETSIGPPQACAICRPSSIGKIRSSPRRVCSTTLGVELRAPVRARADLHPPTAPAEQDAPVLGGAEVVQQRAPVGDRLAAGPAEPLDDVGHRLGQHDVAGGDREPVAQPPDLAGGGVDRTAAVPARTRPPAVSASTPPLRSTCSALTREPSKIRTPRASSRVAQPERQPRRMHGRARRVATPPRNTRRVADARVWLRREREHILAVDGADAAPSWAGRARDDEVRRLAQPGVDLLRLAPVAHHVDQRSRRRRTARAPAARRTRRASAGSSATARRGSRRCARSARRRSGRPRAPPRARPARARAPPTPSTGPV